MKMELRHELQIMLIPSDCLKKRKKQNQDTVFGKIGD